MTTKELRQLNYEVLCEYVWARLREQKCWPPLTDRFSSEAPEDFLIKAAKVRPYGKMFRRRLSKVFKEHLKRITAELESPVVLHDCQRDEHIASIAFAAWELEFTELVMPLQALMVAILRNMTPGQKNVLRTLRVFEAQPWTDVWHLAFKG